MANVVLYIPQHLHGLNMAFARVNNHWQTKQIAWKLHFELVIKCCMHVNSGLWIYGSLLQQLKNSHVIYFRKAWCHVYRCIEDNKTVAMLVPNSMKVNEIPFGLLKRGNDQPTPFPDYSLLWRNDVRGLGTNLLLKWRHWHRLKFWIFPLHPKDFKYLINPKEIIDKDMQSECMRKFKC